MIESQSQSERPRTLLTNSFLAFYFILSRFDTTDTHERASPPLVPPLMPLIYLCLWHARRAPAPRRRRLLSSSQFDVPIPTAIISIYRVSQ